ncbi:MAG TPA: PH domain-containing protein [Candidatus Saccharimonadales bacterium]|nr:PH domain-containing protein [Candidatus Saccharimonadales bacterium]
MLSLEQIESQLKKAGCHFRFWGRGEIRELRKVLSSDEVVEHCVNGRYSNGFAMLVATNHRLLLIDHKPMFSSVEDIRYDMIAELDFSWQLLTGTIRVQTPSRQLRFMSWSHYHLQQVIDRTQAHMQALRDHYTQTAQAAAPSSGGLQMLYDERTGVGVLLGGIVLQNGAIGPIFLQPNPYWRMVPPTVMRRRVYPRFF